MTEIERPPALDSRLKGRDRVLAQIEIWRKELVNLARSNRLLHYRETRASTLGIVASPDEIGPIVDRLRRGTWTFFEPPDTDDDVEPAQLLPTSGELLTDKADRGALLRTLRNLDRRATQEFMDKGLWILYLAAGMLRWVDPDTKEEAASPLVLIPVDLHRESPREPYRLARADEEVVVNPALLLKLEEFGVALPTIDDPDDPDLDAFLAAVERKIRAKPGWTVSRRLVVSHFSFHKEVMYRDLEVHAEEIADHPLIQVLVLGSEEGSVTDFDPLPEEELDEQALPEHGATILPADGTQRQCIDAAVKGRSFVMDGPPGTGKSQTIANMIAENIAVGKSVLFVSEKAAALEVVEKRLQQVGLGDYTLELHSHKASRKEIAHELARALTHYPPARAGMPSSELARLAIRRAELSRRAAAVNEVRQPLGKSLQEAIGRIGELHQVPQAPHPAQIGSDLSAEEYAGILSTTTRLAGSWGPVERGDDFLWRDLADIRLDAATQRRVRDEVDAARTALARLASVGADVAADLGLAAPTDLRGLVRLRHLVEHLHDRPPVPREWLTDDDLAPVHALVGARRSQVAAYQSESTVLASLVGPAWRGLPVGEEEAASENVERLQASPLGSRVRKMRLGKVERLAEAIDEGLEILARTQQAGDTIAGVLGLPVDEPTLARATELAELAKIADDPVRPERQWLSTAGLAEAREAVAELRPLVESLRERRAALRETFTEDVLDLDLDGLIARFRDIHKGLGKLRGGYRADKRTVAKVAKSGKATTEVITLLPDAREWQRLKQAVEAVEQRRLSNLGSNYYAREETDFSTLERALEVAQRAVELAGAHADPRGLAPVARDASPDVELRAAAEFIAREAGAWAGSAEGTLGTGLVRTLLKEPLRSGVALLADVQQAVKTLLDVHRAVAEVAEADLSVERLIEALSHRSALDEVERDLAETLPQDRRVLGESYQAVDTDWVALTNGLAWAERLRELLDGPVDEYVGSRIDDSTIPPDNLAEAVSRWEHARDRVASNFAADRQEQVRLDLSTTADDVGEHLQALADSVGDIQEWFDYADARSQLVDLGVSEPIDFCERERLTRDALPLVIERAVLERWADEVLAEDKDRIGPVRFEQLANLVEEFRRLDERVIEFAAGRVIAAANARRPRTTLGPAGIIRREGEKQRRHMPVRTLLETAGAVAQALKPCFMMTPLTVSQFLPPGFRFDVVIFDEASQVRPSDAINCIYRGDQLVVAGDEQQLPPTSFFEVAMGDDGDDYEEDQFDEFESILKLCLGAGGLRQLPLRWHYRSQHEALILYSNQSFYDGRLISFPGAVEDAPDVGVAFFHVPDGVYRRGGARDNPREAAKVADRVMAWAEWSVAHPEQEVTLGVVAFSEAQASAIEVELDRRRQERPDLDHYFNEDRLHGYFVKNLENVQGDERDIMIFSVGYGRDENGKLTMNFGPLNRSGGKRRLNVAITRARRRVEVVSSIRADDFSDDLSSEGVRHLRRYLDFAERGQPALSLEIGDTVLDAESPFEEEVLRVIRSWGFDAVPQVGAAGYRIDIGVRHPAEPGRYILGVECDGAMYHSSRVARDRDRLRQEVLEGLGWRLHRVWGTSWYRDRAGAERALRDAIESAISPTANRPVRRRMEAPPQWVEETYDVVSPEELPPWATPYEVARPRPPRWRIEMYDREAQGDLRRMVEEVVTVEGPVARELVLRRVREAWGVGRAGSRIREAFEEAVVELKRSGAIFVSEPNFLAVVDTESPPVRTPTEDEETRRRVDEVPLTELSMAIENVVRDAIRVERDELTQAVARLFGWNRRGSDIGRALDRAVNRLLRNGTLAREGVYLVLGRQHESAP